MAGPPLGLASRRLGRAVCERFRLGWAPGSNQLMQAARRKGINPELLAKIDLAVERNGSLTDRFYERVTFPICDRFGNPMAFSARLLPAAETCRAVCHHPGVFLILAG